MTLASSGSIATAGGSATITVTLDQPVKRDPVLYLGSSDPAVMTLPSPYLTVLKGRSSAQTLVQAASGATGGASTITVTDPSGQIAHGSLDVTVTVSD